MPELADNFVVNLVSRIHGQLPENLPELVEELLENNVFILALQSDNGVYFGCVFESTPTLIITRSFTGHMNLLDAFIKGIILFVRIRLGLQHTIRFYSENDLILTMMGDLVIRFSNDNLLVTRRRLLGPFVDNHATYYQYGNIYS
jgi:hypothetical protein